MSQRENENSANFARRCDDRRSVQAGIGLAMTPAERLRWLQETMEVLRRWQGRACSAQQRPSPG